MAIGRLPDPADLPLSSLPKKARDRLQRLVGGPARLQVITLLALVTAINGADQTTVGTVAPLLEQAFHISHAQIGLILTVSGVTAALTVLPIGLLTDRVCRSRLLWITIVLWAVAMLAAGAAQSYSWLLIARIGLGAASATAGPTLASLIGDYFPSRERARIYGYILTGDLIGAGFALLIAGNLAALLSWRWAFWVLALPSALLAWLVWKFLPEPARGGQSRLKPGAREVKSAEDVGQDPSSAHDDPGAMRDPGMVKALKAADASPRQDLILHADPVSMPFWQAALYVLRVPTNRLLIIASALGYFFLAGVRGFAVIWFRGQYHLSQSTATLLLAVIGLGSVAGVLAAGRITDRLMKRRHADARLLVPGVAFLLTVALFVPALLVDMLWIAAPLYFLAAAALGAPNPPGDAARLDIMHFRLWGRAESVRTFLRTLLESFAPFLFGVVADLIAGGRGGNGSSAGLQFTFLIMLLPLIVAGLLLLIWGRKTYVSDVQTALASEDAARKP